MATERVRLDEAGLGVPWRRWGPYLSERQWGTVREDYSESGDAWNYFTHDQARFRAYRRGEDGLAGISDDRQQLCFAMALWNGNDPILKERLFGLTNGEGNHGEDVKEYYYYLDSTPTHSYMRYLYKYPHRAFPYLDLVESNRRRSRSEPEYELLDTGVFDDDRYFDVEVEYAKAGPEDLLILVTVHNRGPEPAEVHVLPTLWFRNTWSWDGGNGERPKDALPSLSVLGAGPGAPAIAATHPVLGRRWLRFQGSPELYFTENTTNTQRLYGVPNATAYVKDAFHEAVVHGNPAAVNPARVGTKAAAHYRAMVGPGESWSIRARLSDQPPSEHGLGAEFQDIFAARRREAEEFYATIIPAAATPDEAGVARQALAGMLWSKQHYLFDVNQWLAERGVEPLEGDRRQARNRQWFHMVNDEIVSMPDKWEYPWYAAWDLAFHTIALAMVDIDFAKSQLELLVSAAYLHPSGQIPAYEWNFGDVNPPVHPWATLYVYRMEEAQRGRGDRDFLARMFSKLTLNFTWWVNQKDRYGKNVFEGGFLGLDNIGVFDRSAPLPTGGHLEQADGTAWMALFCQNMLEMSVELAAGDPSYDELATKFADHFLWIAAAVNTMGPDGMWDEEDGFYYDVLRLPDGRSERLKARSLVGLLPLCATTVIEPWQRERVPRTLEHLERRLRAMPRLRGRIHATGRDARGVNGRGIAALVTEQRLRRILRRMLDEAEFLGPCGIRSLSREHLSRPYVLHAGGNEYRVSYQPAESDSGMFGGNSNWRGPVWMPINVMIIRALLQFHWYYGDAFTIECPTGSGRQMDLAGVAREIGERLVRIFLRGSDGRRPVFGGAEKFQRDPHWRDHLLFYEYFHGDNGAGIGASHQTGWTGLVAPIIDLIRRPAAARSAGRAEAFARGRSAGREERRQEAPGAGEAEPAAL